MRLARQLGMTRSRLLDEMPASELTLWLAYDRIEPLDDPYWRSAMLARTVAGAFGGGKGPRPKIEDFMPTRRPRRQTVREMRRHVGAVLARRRAAERQE